MHSLKCFSSDDSVMFKEIFGSGVYAWVIFSPTPPTHTHTYPHTQKKKERKNHLKQIPRKRINSKWENKKQKLENINNQNAAFHSTYLLDMSKLMSFERVIKPIFSKNLYPSPKWGGGETKQNPDYSPVNLGWFIAKQMCIWAQKICSILTLALAQFLFS